MRQTLRKLNTRLAALMMAAVLLLCAVPAASAAEASGTCGNKLKWSLSGDTLTITGSGAMYDFPETTMAPWYQYRKEISTLRLPDGLTRIGNLAFYDCTALKIVSMPDSVTEVGKYAFSGCTGLTMLDLSSSLHTIQDGGFRECTALPSVRLPKSLKTIAYQGFYRCESLTEIIIPAATTDIGASAFSFCYNLVRAEIQAPLTRLPDWTFYGCSRLTNVILPKTLKGVDQFAFYGCLDLSNVVYDGDDKDRKQIEEDILRDQEGKIDGNPIKKEEPDDPTAGSPNDGDGNNTGGGTIGDQTDEIDGTPIKRKEPDDPATSTTSEGDENGLEGNATTTITTDGANVITSINIRYSEGAGATITAKVTVTLETAKAWDEVKDKAVEAVEMASETVVDIYIKDNTTLASGALDGFSGKNVTVTVHNASGAVWKFDFRAPIDTAGEFNLSHERLDATPEQLELMGCTTGYQIKFLSDTQVNAEVMIKLPLENVRKNATLYQVEGKDSKQHLQTVVVDNEGYGHFYLASVDSRTVYLIGIDVPSENPEDAIVPEVLHWDFGITDAMPEMEYVVTGQTSSWGMDINQVTYILAGGMLGVVVVVGVVMFALNKRKLKRGYIPQWEDDEEE